MSKSKQRYSDEAKAGALAALDANGGNLTRTARETGVSRQALRDWAATAAQSAHLKKDAGGEEDVSWWPAFLDALADTCHVTDAAKTAGVSRRTVYDHRAAHPEFAAAWDEAKVVGADALEDEAVRRAKEGTLKPVFQGGELVGHVREYSDTLLIFLLKGAKPAKYRERFELTGKDGAPLLGKSYLFDPETPPDQPAPEASA